MALTKAQVVDTIVDQIGFTQKHSFEIIETLLEIMKKTLESGQDVFDLPPVFVPLVKLETGAYCF